MQIDSARQKNIENKAVFFKALSEPIRLQIIEFFIDKDMCNCICDLSKFLDRDQSVIFRHLQILKSAGIVTTRKEKNCLFCCLKDKKRLKRILEV